MKFAFIHAEKAFFTVAAMCRLLGVSRQGYYAYANRPPSARVRSDAELCEAIRAIFAETGETYGSPRVYRELKRRGVHVAKRRGARPTRPRARIIRSTRAFPTRRPSRLSCARMRGLP